MKLDCRHALREPTPAGALRPPALDARRVDRTSLGGDNRAIAMRDPDDTLGTDTASPASRSRPWTRELPYLVILLLTLVGAGYASMTHAAMAGYWEIVALCNFGVCVYAGWHHAPDGAARWHLIWTQLLHWGAFLAAMNLVFLPSVQAVTNVDSTSLIVLLLLALGTFIAGVHTVSWRMGVNGIVMAICVPAVAWLDQSAFLLVLGLGVLAVGVVGYWVFLRKLRLSALTVPRR